MRDFIISIDGLGEDYNRARAVLSATLVLLNDDTRDTPGCGEHYRWGIRHSERGYSVRITWNLNFHIFTLSYTAVYKV